MRNCNKKNQRGITLLELMVTVAVISIGVVGIFHLIQNTILSASSVRLRITATYLAQEGVELVKNVRSTNWIKEKDSWLSGMLFCSGTHGCEMAYNDSNDGSLREVLSEEDLNYLKINNYGFYGYETGIETLFKRQIYVEQENIDGVDVAKVTAKVSWQERGNDHQVEVVSVLRNWR